MPPHLSQPGLEVNDSPGLEVAYVSSDVKRRIEDQAVGGGGRGAAAAAAAYQHYETAPGWGGGYRQTNFHNSNNNSINTSPHPQISPIDYPRSNNYYDGSDKEVLPFGLSSTERKKILGLPVWAFWLIVILISAGAIAGGVGGSLAVKNAEINAQRAAAAAAAESKSSSSSTASTATPTEKTPSPPSERIDPTPTTSSSSKPSTTTSTSQTASTATQPQPSQNPNIPFDGGCPRINNTTFTPTTPTGNEIGVPGVGLESQTFLRLCNTNYPSGEEYGNPGISDIFKTFASTLDECMAICAAYNAEFNKPGSTQFNREKGFCRSVAIVEREGEFCYLKNGTGGNNTFGAPNDFASAVLIDQLIIP